MTDNRLTNVLVRYWNDRRKNNALAEWEDPSAAISDVWPRCCVWSVDYNNDNTPKYKFEYTGQQVKSWLGEDSSALIYGNMFLKFPNTRIVKRSEDVLQNLFPFIDEGECLNHRDVLVKFRSCLIPFGVAGPKVTHILLGLSWKLC